MYDIRTHFPFNLTPWQTLSLLSVQRVRCKHPRRSGCGLMCRFEWCEWQRLPINGNNVESSEAGRPQWLSLPQKIERINISSIYELVSQHQTPPPDPCRMLDFLVHMIDLIDDDGWVVVFEMSCTLVHHTEVHSSFPSAVIMVEASTSTSMVPPMAQTTFVCWPPSAMAGSCRPTACQSLELRRDLSNSCCLRIIFLYFSKYGWTLND